VSSSGDATVVVREEREELDGRAASERGPAPIDEARISDPLDGGRETPLEKILSLREGGGVERVLSHVIYRMQHRAAVSSQ
jgi:hypothetical protein